MHDAKAIAESEDDGVVGLHLRCENKDEGRRARGEVGEALILMLRIVGL
jgi:hypothetical protein